MGYDVDVMLYDWNDLLEALLENGCYNRYVVEGVLNMYGTKVCDRYILVTDENMGDSDPMWSLYHAVETLFDKDFFDLIDGIEYEYIKGYSGSCLDEEEELKRFIEIVDGDKHEK